MSPAAEHAPAGRPHIGYLTGEYPRASDTFIQREVAGLREDGFDVDTFAVRRPGPEHLVGPEQREGQATTSYLLESARSPGTLLGHVRMLTANPRRYLGAVKLAARTARPGLRGALFQAIYFLEAGILAGEIRKRGIDHLHNHFGDSSCTVAMLAAELADVPFSFTLHGPAIFFEPYTWHLGEKLDRAAFCACISHFARSQAAIFASPDQVDHLHIVHCGVQPERMASANHEPDGNRLVTVGRLVELKGMSVLLDAVNRLQETNPKVELTVIGDGPDRARFEQKAKRLGLADRVHFVGAQSQAEVAEHLGRSDVFVLPSFAEGVPVVLMEAMATGLPVVTTHVGGMTELIDDGVSGYLVRPGDVEQLTGRIAGLLADPDLRSTLGDAGRERVFTDFVSHREAARLGGLFTATARGLPSPVRPPLPTGD